MASFFLHRNYPPTVVDRALQRVSAIPREAAIRQSDGAGINKEVIPLIITYNPTNIHVKNILTRNFELLKSDPWKSSVAHESSLGIAATPI